MHLPKALKRDAVIAEEACGLRGREGLDQFSLTLPGEEAPGGLGYAVRAGRAPWSPSRLPQSCVQTGCSVDRQVQDRARSWLNPEAQGLLTPNSSICKVGQGAGISPDL